MCSAKAAELQALSVTSAALRCRATSEAPSRRWSAMLWAFALLLHSPEEWGWHLVFLSYLSYAGWGSKPLGLVLNTPLGSIGHGLLLPPCQPGNLLSRLVHALRPFLHPQCWVKQCASKFLHLIPLLGHQSWWCGFQKWWKLGGCWSFSSGQRILLVLKEPYVLVSPLVMLQEESAPSLPGMFQTNFVVIRELWQLWCTCSRLTYTSSHQFIWYAFGFLKSSLFFCTGALPWGLLLQLNLWQVVWQVVWQVGAFDKHLHCNACLHHHYCGFPSYIAPYPLCCSFTSILWPPFCWLTKLNKSFSWISAALTPFWLQRAFVYISEFLLHNSFFS